MIQKIFLCILFIIVTLNVYVTLNLSNELYNIVAKRNVPSALRFLSSLKGTSEYGKQQDFLAFYLPSEFNDKLEIDKTKTERKIVLLQSALMLNTKQPQILLQLSQAYREKGNASKSEKLLKQAREIDPFIAL